jgi:hypothetical protein
MAYSNMTFTVSTGLAFVVNDFVQISAVDPTTTSTSTTTTTTTAAGTSTTSTTTTVVASYRYSSANPGDACNSGLTMTNIVLTGGAFCSAATTIQCDEFTLEAAGVTVYVSFGGNYRNATINDPNVSGIATFDTSCTTCP